MEDYPQGSREDHALCNKDMRQLRPEVHQERLGRDVDSDYGLGTAGNRFRLAANLRCMGGTLVLRHIGCNHDEGCGGTQPMPNMPTRTEPTSNVS